MSRRNITNLNEAFENYKNIVKKITNQYKSPIKSYEEFFLNQEVYEAYEKYKLNGDDIDIKKGFEKAKQRLRDDFYQAMLEENLLADNPSLIYKRFCENGKSTDGRILIFTLNGVYDLRLFINMKKNSDSSSADEEKLNNIKDYIVGRKKGPKLLQEHSIPEETADNLFFTQKVEKLNNDIIVEIQKHIDIIKKGLRLK